MTKISIFISLIASFIILTPLKISATTITSVEETTGMDFGTLYVYGNGAIKSNDCSGATGSLFSWTPSACKNGSFKIKGKVVSGAGTTTNKTRVKVYLLSPVKPLGTTTTTYSLDPNSAVTTKDFFFSDVNNTSTDQEISPPVYVYGTSNIPSNIAKGDRTGGSFIIRVCGCNNNNSTCRNTATCN